MIIGLTGLARCGKDTMAAYLKEKYGYEILVFSDVLVEEAEKRGLEPTKMNLSILGDELRAAEGNAVVAKRLMKKIDKEKEYVLSGVRSPEEVYAIQNEMLDFNLVYIDTERSTRFKRRKPEDPQSEEDFFERDGRDIQNKGLGKVIEMADYTISNNSSVKEFYKKIDELVKKIQSE